MKNKNAKQLLVLSVLCIVLLLTGAVAVEDNNTYGAYPGTPTQVPTPTPSPNTAVTQPQIAYPTQPADAATTSTVTSPVIPAGASGSATALYYAQAPPVAQQNVLLTYNIQTAPPAAVYYRGSYMPWTSFYQVFPATSPALWVSSSAGWSWYATCPVGSWVQVLMYVPVTGTMKTYDLYPDGNSRYDSYGFATPGYKYRWFNANAPGRYITMLTIADIPSNYITIDVA